MNEYDKGITIVLRPEDGEAIWQPKPSTGYIVNKINPYNSRSTVSPPAFRSSSPAAISADTRMSASTKSYSAIAARAMPRSARA